MRKHEYDRALVNGKDGAVFYLPDDQIYFIPFDGSTPCKMKQSEPWQFTVTANVYSFCD